LGRHRAGGVGGEEDLVGNQVGKRYRCEHCGTEVLVTRPGDGGLACCDTPMVLQQPKQTASAD
jgi:desulfoferrodoxin-like iron-binding protein